MPTNDYKIEWTLHDEYLDSIRKASYFCGQISVNLIDIKQTGEFWKKITSNTPSYKLAKYLAPTLKSLTITSLQ